ncbi:hypothetical protein [Streptomyces sp. NPDC005799]|uniref:hypothetical protein n=1 Tax=Streptomyces sp. NPDC005799 TaxID=3154678 RepID=UPI0033D27C64
MLGRQPSRFLLCVHLDEGMVVRLVDATLGALVPEAMTARRCGCLRRPGAVM